MGLVTYSNNIVYKSMENANQGFVRVSMYSLAVVVLGYIGRHTVEEAEVRDAKIATRK